MKYRVLYFSLLVAFGLLFSASCNKEPVEEPQQFDYFVDAEFLQSIPATQAQLVIAVLSGMTDLFPAGGAAHAQMLAEIRNLAVYDSDVYKIIYKTTFNDKEVKASGLVCIPRRTTGAGKFPILNFQNGTIVLHDDAPSRIFRSSQSMQFIATLSTSGFVIVIPDQLGFGASSDMHHPYFHKASMIETTLNMISAVQEMALVKEPGSNASRFGFELSDDISIMGYSQGGSNTIYLGEALQDPARSVNLRYAAAGGGAYSISRTFEKVLQMEYYERPDYLGYVLQSLFRSYNPGIQYSDILNPPFAERIDQLYNGKKNNNQIIAQLTTDMKKLFREDFINGYKTDPKFTELRHLMDINSPKAWKTTVPVMVKAALGDEQVPYTESEALYNEFRALGVEGKIAYEIYPYQNMGHVDAALPFFIEAFHAILKTNQQVARKSGILSGR